MEQIHVTDINSDKYQSSHSAENENTITCNICIQFGNSELHCRVRKDHLRSYHNNSKKMVNCGKLIQVIPKTVLWLVQPMKYLWS